MAIGAINMPPVKKDFASGANNMAIAKKDILFLKFPILLSAIAITTLKADMPIVTKDMLFSPANMSPIEIYMSFVTADMSSVVPDISFLTADRSFSATFIGTGAVALPSAPVGEKETGRVIHFGGE